MLQRSVYAFDPETGVFAMVLGGQTVGIWRLDEVGEGGDRQEGVAPKGTLETKRSMILGVIISEDGTLVTVHETGLVLGWDLATVMDGEPQVRFELDMKLLVTEVTAYRGGDSGRQRVALGAESGHVVMLELVRGGAPVVAKAEKSHGDKVEVLEFSEDGERLATSARDRGIAIWSTEIKTDGEGEPLLERLRWLTSSGGWPLSLAFSKDHRRLVSGCMDNGVYLWDLEAEEAQKAVRFDHAGWVEDVTWTSDGAQILTASWDNACGVFDGERLRPLFQFGYHKDYVVRVLDVPGTTHFFAASYDGEVSVWDRASGELVAVLKGHGDWVTELVWLGEGRVASLSSDGTARIWSTATMGVDAVLGEAAVESFELGGNFDLSSFGIGSGQEEREEEAISEVEALQTQVVRRFDADDPMLEMGSQKTAMAMLEDVVDEGGELGEELSDMVWDAIGEADEAVAQGGVASVAMEGVEDDIDIEIDIDISAEDFPSIDEIAAEAFEQVQYGELSQGQEDEESEVDIMGAAFDLAPEEALNLAAETEPPVEEPSPVYDPQPIGPDDDLSGILPDDIEFDRAFGSSLSSSSVEEDFGEEDLRGKEDAGEEEGPPGKGEPSVAGEFSVEAVGGEEGIKAGTSISAMERAAVEAQEEVLSLLEESHPALASSQEALRPLSTVASGGSESGEEEQQEEGLDRSKLKKLARRFKMQKARRIQEQTSRLEEESEPMVAEEPLRQDAAQFSKVRTEIVDAEKVAQIDAMAARRRRPIPVDDSREEEQEKKEVEEQSEAEEVAVDPDWGNSTQLWTGTSEPGDEPERVSQGERAEETKRRLGEFTRREKTLGRGKLKTPLTGQPRVGGEGRASSTPALKTKGELGTLTLEEGTVPVVEGLLAPMGKGEQGPRDRLMPGEEGLSGELRIPEPEVSEVDGEERSTRLVSVEIGELWERASLSAPPMGILKRKMDPRAEYVPALQFQTEHMGAMRIALASTDKRLVTVGADGVAELWQMRGKQLARFKVSDQALVEVGFVKGQDFLWVLDRGGTIHLLLMPRAALGKSSRFSHGEIAGEGAYRSGWFVENQGLLLTGSEDGKARLWSLEKGKCVARFADHEAAVTAVAVGRRGPITASEDGQIRFWNRRGLLVDQIETSSAVASLVAQQGLVAWVQENGALSMMREGDSRPTRLQGHHGQGRALAFREDGYFISGGEDGRLLVYDGQGEHPVQEVHLPAPVHRLALSERVLAVACEGGKVFAFRRRSAKAKA